MKKIISLLSALAIFSSMAISASAAVVNGKDIKTANANAKIEATVADVDTDGFAYINFKVTSNETLSYSSKLNKVTGTQINAIQIKVTLNSEVFNIGSGETYMMANEELATLSNTSGDGTADLTYVFAPTAVAGYMNKDFEYVCQVAALVNDGYTIDNIPSDAVTFNACKVEYTQYNNIKPVDSETEANLGVNYFYTIYGANTVGADYALTTNFIGTAEEGGEEGGDNDDTAIEMVAGNQNIVGGRHDGKAAISAPEAVAVEGIAKITVENSADADRVEEWVAPTTLGNGKTKVLAVVTYDKAAMAGTTFTVKYLNAALEAIKTFTYTVGQ